METEKISLVIPEEIEFSSLHLSRAENGALDFEWSPIEKICAANGIPDDIFKKCHEDNVAGLLAHWYLQHRRQGGAPDFTAEELIEEMLIEEQAGQSVSYEPGTA